MALFDIQPIGPVEAHAFSFHNRSKLEQDLECGCFYCMKIFPVNEIEEWEDDGETAICPYCGIDSVIGESSGYPLTEADLKEMHLHWFGRTGLSD